MLSRKRVRANTADDIQATIETRGAPPRTFHHIGVGRLLELNEEALLHYPQSWRR